MLNLINSSVVSVALVDGKLEVITRTPSNMAYCNGTPCPDSIKKQTYAAVDGKIVLESTIDGKHVPARFVPESIEFPK